MSLSHTPCLLPWAISFHRTQSSGLDHDVYAATAAEAIQHKVLLSQKHSHQESGSNLWKEFSAFQDSKTKVGRSF